MVRLYPNITKACLEIAFDNGGVNRGRPVKQVLKEIRKFLDGHKYDQFLPDIDFWLSTLSEEDLQTVCTGEESDIAALTQNAPPFTDELLNDYFDEVC